MVTGCSDKLCGPKLFTSRAETPEQTKDWFLFIARSSNWLLQELFMLVHIVVYLLLNTNLLLGLAHEHTVSRDDT